jgi:transposase-like protein
MKRKYSCPNCKSRETIKKGKRKGKERRKCNSCGRWFSINRSSKGISKAELTNLHLSGISFRRLAEELLLYTVK